MVRLGEKKRHRPARAASISLAWVHGPRVDGLALPKSVESANLRLANAIVTASVKTEEPRRWRQFRNNP
jgi:hypothetical protein